MEVSASVYNCMYVCMKGGLQRWHIFVLWSPYILFLTLPVGKTRQWDKDKEVAVEIQGQQGLRMADKMRGEAWEKKREVTLVVIGGKEAKASGSPLSLKRYYCCYKRKWCRRKMTAYSWSSFICFFNKFGFKVHFNWLPKDGSNNETQFKFNTFRGRGIVLSGGTEVLVQI